MGAQKHADSQIRVEGRTHLEASTNYWALLERNKVQLEPGRSCCDLRAWRRQSCAVERGLLHWNASSRCHPHGMARPALLAACGTLTQLANCKSVDYIVMRYRHFSSLPCWFPAKPTSTHRPASEQMIRPAQKKISKAEGTCCMLCSIIIIWNSAPRNPSADLLSAADEVEVEERRWKWRRQQFFQWKESRNQSVLFLSNFSTKKAWNVFQEGPKTDIASF